MGDSLITVVAIMVASVLMFLFPMLTVAERNDDISQISVQTATAEFVDNIRSTGKLQQVNYDNYLKKLAATGNSYDVELERKVLDENPGKKVTWASSKKIGENVYYSEYTEKILKDLQENGELNLKEGDIISVSVKNTNTTMSQMLRNFFYTVVGQGTSEVQASHAGMVLVNGNK